MTPRDADHAAIAKAIVDANVYMTLGTADADGRPWVSPVFFAAADYSDYYWISSPDARHSRNIAVRPQVSIVVFDSRIPVGTGQAVYMEATVEQLAGADVTAGLEIYPGGPERGARTISPDELRPPGPYRLYRARATQHWILDPSSRPDRRTAVTL
jgi:pyridoxine/pyridoxamine 5'-phosphate oxidase